MCYETPRTEIVGLNINNSFRVVGLKVLTLSTNGVTPPYIISPAYKVTPRKDGVEFEEEKKNLQPITILLKTQDGHEFDIQSNHKLRLGMHITIPLRQFTEPLRHLHYPVIVSPKDILLMSNGEFTTRAFTVPTNKIVKKIIAETNISALLLRDPNEIFIALKKFKYLPKHLQPQREEMDILITRQKTKKLWVEKFGPTWAACEQSQALDSNITFLVHIPTHSRIATFHSYLKARIAAYTLAKKTQPSNTSKFTIKDRILVDETLKDIAQRF